MQVDFETLPDDARLWVFPAAEPITGDPARRLLERVDAFIADWKAHGTPLSAGRDWRQDRFLLVAVDERTAPPSGCSIDALLKVLKELEAELDVTITDHIDVLHRAPDGTIARDDRSAFARRAREGGVDLDTPVFDTTLTRMGELRAGKLEVPAKESWHRRAFFRSTVGGLALLVGGSLLAAGVLVAQEPERAAFVTRLGEDTVAVERFQIAPGRIDAEVLLRSPEVTLGRYVLETSGTGRILRYRAEVRPVGEEGPVSVQTLERSGGGYVMRSETPDGEREEPWAVGGTALPFIEQAHWPFEVALRRAVEAEGDSIAQTVFTGAQGMDYALLRRGGGKWGLRHPSRGTSSVRVDDEGRLLALDGSGTTSALLLERTDWLDLEQLAQRFAGRPMGELSGRGETVRTIDGVGLAFDFGTPAKRGREIFGDLVPYGEEWRTGANAATTMTIDRALLVDGELVLAPGTYTLTSIPRDDGAELIFTGEDGEEVGRVQMGIASLGQPVEVLHIGAMDMPRGGEIEIVWDRTRYWVPFVVR